MHTTLLQALNLATTTIPTSHCTFSPANKAHYLSLLLIIMYDQVSLSDDDVLASNQNRVLRGSGNACNKRRTSVNSVTHQTLQSKMDTMIHQIEKEAYSWVLRALKCQAEVLTWEKADLMADLRKELKVSDDEHIELLAKVNVHSTINQIREWRQRGWCQPAICSTAQPVHDNLPNPTVSSSQKKQKTSQLFWHQHQSLPGSSSEKSMMQNHSYSSSLIGKKVWIRWPEDNEFYEAQIRMYNPAKGQHALVYDIGEANETVEWVDLNQIPAEDIRWKGEGRHT